MPRIAALSGSGPMDAGRPGSPPASTPAPASPSGEAYTAILRRRFRREMTAILRELDRGTYQVPNKITVALWMTEWLSTFCEGKVKLLTFQGYQGIIKNHIVPAIGSLELQAVKGLHIQRLYNTMTRAGLSGKTVKNVSAMLHKAFSVALKQGIIAANPCDAAQSGA